MCWSEMSYNYYDYSNYTIGERLNQEKHDERDNNFYIDDDFDFYIIRTED